MVGRVSCIVVGQRRPGAVPCWECSSWDPGTGGSREQTASVSQAQGSPMGQGEEEATGAISNTSRVWRKAGIYYSLWGFSDVLRGNQGEGILGHGSEKRSRTGRHL